MMINDNLINHNLFMIYEDKSLGSFFLYFYIFVLIFYLILLFFELFIFYNNFLIINIKIIKYNGQRTSKEIKAIKIEIKATEKIIIIIIKKVNTHRNSSVIPKR